MDGARHRGAHREAEGGAVRVHATEPTTAPPSEAQMRVLRFIAIHQRIAGKPPTFRETATHLGVVSTNAVNDHVQALIKKGWLTRSPTAPMADRFTEAHLGFRTKQASPYRLTEEAMTLIFGPPCPRCRGTGRAAGARP